MIKITSTTGVDPDFIEKKRKPKKDREVKVERYGCDKVEDRDGIAYKFTSPGHASVPDRLMLERIDNIEHRLIVQQYVKFVEFKRPGEHPTSPQLREHERLRSRGYNVLVIDSKEGVDQWL